MFICSVPPPTGEQLERVFMLLTGTPLHLTHVEMASLFEKSVSSLCSISDVVSGHMILLCSVLTLMLTLLGRVGRSYSRHSRTL